MVASATKPEQAWYQLTAEATAQQLDVDPAKGLSSAAAQQRLEQFGRNRLAAKKKESGIHAFLRQYQDFMQIILMVAAVLSLVFTRQLGTTLVLVGLTVFNAVLGLRQESKAEASLAALEKMLKNVARVRRDGETMEIDAEELVPGDIVLVEAGNRVPADGRLFLAATLEIEEAALTGESTPTLKDTAAIAKSDVGLGDRLCMAFMNTSVTRGRGEMMVTATGMQTEIGHIAELLNKVTAEKTPLQKQLDRLTLVIAGIAGLAFIVIVVFGLARGQPFQTLFITGVALAISAIPTGLPAVVTTLYSMGTRTLAGQNAIVKRLPSVETLGSTSAICSDKTGTLTLNKMTAREFTVPGQNRFRITGEGYSTKGQLLHATEAAVDLNDILLPMALCADARLDGEELIGDPTEGALIVLAEKGGIHVEGARSAYPRVAEVPFDSDYKFMATFHEMTDGAGKPVVRCFVKGAPDVLIARGGSYWMPGGEVLPVTGDNRKLALDENNRMAQAGERVMVVARRDFDPKTFDRRGDLISLVNDLTLLAMVGIVDPPRREAKAAIAKCKGAGIQVRMITGDHVVTAAAIGRELGIVGEALTGAQFASATDEDLFARLPNIGVVARVAPEDKIRLVGLLQRKANIVAMTGDGVNDAPALKKADIGVAMGITGTEVSKDAAVMVLTDDNFATIVKAVEYGRALYDNLVKYIRFQMATLVGFIASFLGAAIFGVAGGIPFTPLEVLWVNFAIDVPIAIALGFGAPSPGLMDRKPRPINAPVISRGQWVVITVLGIIMAVGTLLLLAYAEPVIGAVAASTLALTAFSLFQVAAGLTAQDETRTVFNRDSLQHRRQVGLFGLSLALIYLVTQIGFLQRIFDTTALTLGQWLICIGAAATLVIVDEIIKFFLRRSRRAAEDRSSAGLPTSTGDHTESHETDLGDQAAMANAS
jgi:P-type Ca2+ transporter type 2C